MDSLRCVLFPAKTCQRSLFRSQNLMGQMCSTGGVERKLEGKEPGRSAAAFGERGGRVPGEPAGCARREPRRAVQAGPDGGQSRRQGVGAQGRFLPRPRLSSPSSPRPVPGARRQPPAQPLAPSSAPRSPEGRARPGPGSCASPRSRLTLRRPCSSLRPPPLPGKRESQPRGPPQPRPSPSPGPAGP